MLSEARAQYPLPKAPAMPLYLDRERSASESIHVASASASEQNRPHDDHFASKGYASEEYFGLVHIPVPIPKALLIPEAKAALEKEWKKLETRTAWDIKGVRPKAEVIVESQASGVPAHFGS